MKSKFDFYEIVKIKTIDPQKSEVNGKKGYVAAKAVSDIRDHNPGSWTYAVSLFDIKYAWSFSENELEATGNFFDKTKTSMNTGEVAEMQVMFLVSPKNKSKLLALKQGDKWGIFEGSRCVGECEMVERITTEEELENIVTE